MKNIYILQGISGCGKSTFTGHLKKLIGDIRTRTISYDQIRYKLNIAHNGEGWTEKKHELAEKSYMSAITRNCGRSSMDNIIIDDTHTTMKSMYKVLMSCAQGLMGAEANIVVICLDTPLAVCKERRKECDFPMEVIDKQHRQLVEEFSKRADYPTLVDSVLRYTPTGFEEVK